MKKTGIAVVAAIAVALSCLFLLLSSGMLAPVLAQEDEPPDLTITAIKPYHYEWYEEYDIPKGEPWFNLKNYVEVTVVNIGNGTAGSFVVTLYADEEPIESKPVEGLPADGVTDVKFEWMLEGEDPLSWTDTAEGAICTYTDTSKVLKAVVDKDEEVPEEDENNNELTAEQKVIWNGYMADEPLENYVHGEVEGGIIYTTGDGQYRGRFTDGTEYGTYYDVNYDLEIPGSVKLARLYIYHTWSKPDHTAPKIGVTLKTPSGNHDLAMEKSYNDIKGDFGAWWYVWGTYVYDITDYVGESGTYVVTVTNLNSGSDSDFATEYAFAAPAILVVYEDTTAPKREYWINEGADILMGGRRGDGGFLSLEDCRNSATFDGEHLDLEIEKATLAVVSPWGEDVKNVLYFNDEELGEGVYCGYHDPCSSDEEIEGISMIIGASEAQVGIAAFDVTDDLEDYDNKVIQGDDGDNMMPVNAFLVITYPSAARTLPAETVSAGERFTVVINVSYYGHSVQVIETLPEGFVYEGSTLNQESVEVVDNTVKFELRDEHFFNYTYTVRAPESEDTYRFSGALIAKGDEYEVGGDKEIKIEEDGDDDEKKEEGTSGPPNIIAWNPVEAVVNNTEGEPRTFNITVNQTVDISWRVNGTEVQTNGSVTKAAYTNTSAVIGIWNVSAIATNTTTELSDMHTGIWVVTPALTATLTPATNIIQTPTPGATPASTVNATPTPTPASTQASESEEEKKPETEAPVPGFELAISLSMSIAVAYLIKKRRERRD